MHFSSFRNRIFHLEKLPYVQMHRSLCPIEIKILHSAKSHRCVSILSSYYILYMHALHLATRISRAAASNRVLSVREGVNPAGPSCFVISRKTAKLRAQIRE